MATKPASSKIKRVYLISDEAIRRCGDAGLRVMMPLGSNPNEPETSYSFDLLESGSLVITVKRPSGTRRSLVPQTAFMAELE